MSKKKLQLHPYEPTETPFVLNTLCSVIARAESWSAVVAGTEALANSLRIAKGFEEEAFRANFNNTAALASDIVKDIEAEALRTGCGAVSLDQLKESGRELRGLQNRCSDES